MSFSLSKPFPTYEGDSGRCPAALPGYRLRFQQRRNFFNAGGFARTLNHRLIVQRVGQAGNHRICSVITGGDTDNRAEPPHPLLPKRTPSGYWQKTMPVFRTPVFGFNGAVRYRDGLAPDRWRSAFHDPASHGRIPVQRSRLSPAVRQANQNRASSFVAALRPRECSLHRV